MPSGPDQQEANERVNRVIHRNIRSLLRVRQTVERGRSLRQRVADAIGSFSGSWWFISFNLVFFGAWMLANAGLMPGVPIFDRFPFNLLTLITSLEAIFLSAFILISQKRMTELADQRADLDLQINLLAEYEITRLITLSDAIAAKLGVSVDDSGGDLDELKRIVDPEEVLNEIERSGKAEPKPAP